MAQSVVKRGSVVLIRYPFTDLTGAKVRPALVLTPDHLLPRLDDVLCLFISSAMPDDLLPTDFVLESEHSSFPQTGLKRRSVLRMHKLALLHKALWLSSRWSLDRPNRRASSALGRLGSASIIGSATLNDRFHQGKRPKRPSHKALEKAGICSKLPQVADAVIRALGSTLPVRLRMLPEGSKSSSLGLQWYIQETS